MTAQQSQQHIAAAYDTAAASYDTFGVPFFTPIGARLVQEARVRAGHRVLDAGCGAGAVSVPAARATSPGGHVTAIDLSPKMLARTKTSAAALGLGNVTVAVADAHRPPYKPASFDAVLSSMLVFLLPEPAAAARAWRTLLRPGGVAAFSWIVAEDPRWVSVIAAVDALAGGASFARLWHHPPFTGLQEVDAMLTAAGYDEITTSSVTVPRRYTGPRQWWGASWSQAPMLAWQDIPRGLRLTARSEAFRRLEAMREPDGSLTRDTVIGYTTGRQREGT